LLLQGKARGENVQRSRRRVFGDDAIRSLVGDVPSLAHDLPADPLLMEQETYLRDTLLRDTDVMGMAHGVEIRAPFLDPEVIGVARGIGSAALLDRKRAPKWPLRDGWRQQLDAEALARRKTGFTLDLAGWLQKDGRDRLESSREQVLELAADRNDARRTWALAVGELRRGHASSWVRAFSLIQLAEQYRRWGAPV
jgi:asparagine synthetase B (glutamine-hydrolysing)